MNRCSAIVFMLLPLMLLMGCQERYGPCPVVDDVSPAEGGAGDIVEVRGQDFALGHSDLFDDGRGVPPDVWLELNSSPMMEAMAPELADLEMAFPVDTIIFVSSEKLHVEMPATDWNDVATGFALYGVELDPALLPATLPVSTTVYVRNAEGCEASWEGELVFNLVVREEG